MRHQPNYVALAIATLALTALSCFTVKADTLVDYQFATNNFGPVPANGASAGGAVAPYSSVVSPLLSSASTISSNGINLTYRTTDTVVNNGSAAANQPALDARIVSSAPTPQANQYFQFSFTAASDLDLTTLSYDLGLGANTTTARGADVLYSLDGFTTSTDLGTATAPGTTANVFAHFSYDLGDTLVTAGTTVTVRFEPFVAAGGAGGVRFDNIEIDGVSAVPEPASMALLGLGGLGALLMKRRKA